MNIEDKAPLTGNYNRTDLRLVVVDMAQSPTPDGNQARTVAASDLFAQLEQGREVIPFEALTSLTWNVVNQPRVYLELTADLAHITTVGAGNGFYFELHARQPQGGGKKLTIDGVPVLINRTGNTLILARYIGGVLDLHTDASAEAGKPVLLDESVSQTVLAGEYAEVWAKFAGANEYTVERDGKPVPDATGAALLVKVSDQTAGAYEVIGKNEYGETRSSAKFIKPGEAEAVYVKTQPQSVTLPAGNEFELTAEFAGTPPPSVACFEVVNGVRGAQVASGSKWKGTALYTKSYQFTGTNTYKVPVVITPAVLGPDGTTIITPAVTELQKKSFTAESAVVIVTPVKQAQAAPNPIEQYDNQLDKIKLGALLAGKTLADYRVKILNDAVVTPTSLLVDVGDRDLELGSIEVFYIENDSYKQSPSVFNTKVFTSSLAKIPYDPALKQNVTISNGTVTKTGSNENSFAADNIPVKFLQAEVLNIDNQDVGIIGLATEPDLKSWFNGWFYSIYPYQGTYLMSQNSPAPLHFSPDVTVMVGDKYSLDIKLTDNNDLLVTATVTRADKTIVGTYEFTAKFPVTQNFYAKVQPAGEASFASVANVKFFPA